MAKPALPWLQRLCALYEKHEPSVYSCRAEPHSSGVLISLELDRGSVYLLAQPKERSGAYASTASMDVAIHNPPGAGRMPGNGELIIRQFIALLQRADKGDVHIKSQGMNVTPASQEIVRANEQEARQVREDMADDLHYAAFLALRILNAEGSPLHPADAATEEEAHRFLFDTLETGFSRYTFRKRFGIEANELAPTAFDILLSLGAITIDGDAVKPTINSAEELETFRVFFLSPTQRAAGDALWAGEYDSSTDYPRLLAAAVASDS